MDRVEEIDYNYLNSIYDGYKKSGRRPVSYAGDYNEVYYSYEKDGDKAFEYSWVDGEIKIKNSDYNTIRNMFGLGTSQILKIYKQFVFDKVGDKRIFNTNTPFELQLTLAW
jgi:hypothetical protein